MSLFTPCLSPPTQLTLQFRSSARRRQAGPVEGQRERGQNQGMARRASAHKFAPIILGAARWPVERNAEDNSRKSSQFYTHRQHKYVPFSLILPQLNPLIWHNPIPNPKGTWEEFYARSLNFVSQHVQKFRMKCNFACGC